MKRYGFSLCNMLPVFILFCLRDFCNIFLKSTFLINRKSYLNRWTWCCLGRIIKIHAVPYCDQHCTSMKHQIDWQNMKKDFHMRCSSSIVNKVEKRTGIIWNTLLEHDRIVKVSTKPCYLLKGKASWAWSGYTCGSTCRNSDPFSCGILQGTH